MKLPEVSFFGRAETKLENVVQQHFQSWAAAAAAKNPASIDCFTKLWNVSILTCTVKNQKVWDHRPVKTRRDRVCKLFFGSDLTTEPSALTQSNMQIVSNQRNWAAGSGRWTKRVCVLSFPGGPATATQRPAVNNPVHRRLSDLTALPASERYASASVPDTLLSLPE